MTGKAEKQRILTQKTVEETYSGEDGRENVQENRNQAGTETEKQVRETGWTET